VEVSGGKAITTGFCAQMSTVVRTPAMKSRGLEVAAAGLHTDCREVYDSALRIKKAADILSPSARFDVYGNGKDRLEVVMQ
jgi:hypothetical protein